MNVTANTRVNPTQYANLVSPIPFQEMATVAQSYIQGYKDFQDRLDKYGEFQQKLSSSIIPNSGEQDLFSDKMKQLDGALTAISNQDLRDLTVQGRANSIMRKVQSDPTWGAMQTNFKLYGAAEQTRLDLISKGKWSGLFQEKYDNYIRGFRSDSGENFNPMIRAYDEDVTKLMEEVFEGYKDNLEFYTTPDGKYRKAVTNKGWLDAKRRDAVKYLLGTQQGRDMVDNFYHENPNLKHFSPEQILDQKVAPFVRRYSGEEVDRYGLEMWRAQLEGSGSGDAPIALSQPSGIVGQDLTESITFSDAMKNASNPEAVRVINEDMRSAMEKGYNNGEGGRTVLGASHDNITNIINNSSKILDIYQKYSDDPQARQFIDVYSKYLSHGFEDLNTFLFYNDRADSNGSAFKSTVGEIGLIEPEILNIWNSELNDIYNRGNKTELANYMKQYEKDLDDVWRFRRFWDIAEEIEDGLKSDGGRSYIGSYSKLNKRYREVRDNNTIKYNNHVFSIDSKQLANDKVRSRFNGFSSNIAELAISGRAKAKYRADGSGEWVDLIDKNGDRISIEKSGNTDGGVDLSKWRIVNIIVPEQGWDLKLPKFKLVDNKNNEMLVDFPAKININPSDFQYAIESFGITPDAEEYVSGQIQIMGRNTFSDAAMYGEYKDLPTAVKQFLPDASVSKKSDGNSGLIQTVYTLKYKGKEYNSANPFDIIRAAKTISMQK
jgi:hypothetical protein